MNALGATALRIAREIGGMILLAFSVLRALVPPRIDGRELWKNLFKMGNRSVTIVVLTAFFAGGLMTLQTGPFVKKLGATSIAGWGAGYAVLREIGPILIALMFSGRVGANNTAELATMTVTEQLDGLRALAIDPVRYLIVPRVLAMIVALAALTVIGDLVALIGASLVARTMLDIDWATMFYSFADNLKPADFMHGIYKSIAFGGAIAIASCYFGVSVRGGAVGVGRAVNAAVVASAVSILMLDFFVTYLSFAAVIASRIAAAGDAVLGFGRAARELWLVYVATIAGLWRGVRRRRHHTGPPRGEVMRQMFHIGNKSLLFVIVTLGFIGMVMTFEACLQLSRITGDYSQVGSNMIRLAISDFGPTLTGMMLATRVGAGIAAEIGSMKVTEQVDALRMSGVLPIDYLIVPRFVASIVMTLVLTVVGTCVMYAAGGLTATRSFGVNPNLFFDLSLVRPRHVAILVIKAVTYGAAIPIVAGFCGLRARGSSEGVGWATTAAVIGSSFAVIALDFIISAAALFLTGGDL